MHTKQQRQYEVLLEFINETQLAPMIQNPCFYPPDRFLVKTCVITHHINFPGSLAFFIPLSPLHLFVFIFFFVLFCRLFFWPSLPSCSSAEWITAAPFSYLHCHLRVVRS